MTPLLDTTARRLLTRVAHAQTDSRAPSVVAGVVRDGDLVWSAGRGRTVGVADLEAPGAQPDADTQYKIGSVTKTMTAALLMLARERGEVGLDDPVRRFLPDGPFPDATLGRLLSHVGGLTAEPRGTWWERADGGDLAALAAAHAGAEPVLEPGTTFHYSNLGFGVLGGVVEQVTGLSWWEALRTQVLDPLGMGRTTYAHQAPHAAGFAVRDLTGELTVEPLPDTGAMAPAGQLWSTVADLAVWLTALVDPERSVLSADTLRTMATPRSATQEDRSGTSMGLGVFVHRDRGRSVLGHGGSMPGFSCGVLVDRDSRVGAVLLSNAAWGLGGPVVSDLLDTVLTAEPSLPAEWTPTREVPDDVRAVVGTWHWGEAPSRLRWDGARLLLSPLTGPGRVAGFRPGGEPDRWIGTSGYFDGETLRAVRGDDGAVSHLELATFVFTRVPYDPAAPIPGGPPER